MGQNKVSGVLHSYLNLRWQGIPLLQMTILALSLLLCLGLGDSHGFGGKIGGGYAPVYTNFVPYPVAQPIPVPQPVPVPVAIPQPIPVAVPQPVVVPIKRGWKGGFGGLGGFGGGYGGGYGGGFGGYQNFASASSFSSASSFGGGYGGFGGSIFKRR